MALVLLHPCQLYPDGAANVIPLTSRSRASNLCSWNVRLKKISNLLTGQKISVGLSSHQRDTKSARPFSSVKLDPGVESLKNSTNPSETRHGPFFPSCFALQMNPALGITLFPVSTGRTSQPVPLCVHGFFFAFWHLHRLTNGGDSVPPRRNGIWMQVLFFRDTIQQFSSHWGCSSCIHTNCTQMERQIYLHMTR